MDKETDGQRDRQTKRQLDRKTNGKRDRWIDTYEQTTDGQTYRWTDMQMDRQTDGQTERWTNQTDEETDRVKYLEIQIHRYASLKKIEKLKRVSLLRFSMLQHVLWSAPEQNSRPMMAKMRMANMTKRPICINGAKALNMDLSTTWRQCYKTLFICR